MTRNRSPFPLALLSLAALAWSPAQALAALCHPYSDFPRQVASCDDNFALSESAMNCVEDFERAVEQGRARIQKLLEAQVARMKDQQHDSFDRSSAGYQDAQRELDRLISDGEQAKKAVDTYGPELYFPEDYDRPKLTGIGTREYLASEPCFATPSDIVYDSSALLREMIDDLKATRLAALEKDARSADRSTKVGAAAPGPGAVQGGKGLGGANVKSGKDQRSTSNVTGVREDMEKEKRSRH